MKTTLKNTRLGQIVKINGEQYIVCVYRTKFMASVVKVTGCERTKLLPIDTVVEVFA